MASGLNGGLMTVLGISGCSREFAPGAFALSGVTFELLAGEIHVLAGANGAGKSTLIRILAGADSGYTGSLTLDGRPVRFRSPRDADQAGIAVIHQETSLVNELSVAENLFLTGPVRLSRRAELSRARELCQAAGLTLDVRRSVGELSMSERAAVEIAKALARDPRVLILDEPTSSLESAEADRLLETISRLRDRGRAILYITHKMDEIFRVADRITVLRDGRVAAAAPAAELGPDALITAMLGGTLGAREESARGVVRDEIRLEVEGLAGRTLSVRRGEIVGIAGLQGSGKSELLEAIFSGGAERVSVDGRDRLVRTPREAIAAGLALATGDRKRTGVVEAMSIEDNLQLPSFKRAGKRFARIDRDLQRLNARWAIRTLGVRCQGPEQELGELSGGNQQKVILAKWLETNPKALLLDEPTRGVDVGAKREIHALLRRLSGEGLATVLVSSEISELLALSDRVLVMHRGKVTAELVGSEATEARVLAYAMGETA